MSEEPPEQHEDYSQPEDQATNRMLWERGSPLKDVFEARLSKLPDDPALQDALRPGPYAVWRREQVEQTIQDDLIRAKLTACIRLEADVPQYDRVATSYWPGTRLNVAQNSADGRNGQVDHIRLIENRATTDSQVANSPSLKPAIELGWAERHRQKVMMRVFQKHPDAHLLPRKKFVQLCKDEAGPAGQTGFARTKINATRKRLEEEKEIPSRNDHK